MGSPLEGLVAIQQENCEVRRRANRSESASALFAADLDRRATLTNPANTIHTGQFTS